MPSFQTLRLQPSGVDFAYLDSGVPNEASYTTIFLVHGVVFTASIFQKVIDLAPTSSIRIVAVNRRDYPGTSPLSPEDLPLISGSNEDKERYISDRGLELLTFIDQFAEQRDLPPISEDGKTGGVALLGWSLGNLFTVSAIANAYKLETAVIERLSKRLRSLILDDPPSIVLGIPPPQLFWNPVLDESVPSLEKLPFHNMWLTAYFDHEGLNKRDLAGLTYAAPSTAKVPSAYSMHTQLAQIIDITPSMGSDGIMLIHNLGAVLHANCEKALFGGGIQTLFPYLKKSQIGHDSTLALCVTAFWKVQDNDEKHGGGNVRFETVPGTNHFGHWDYPAVTLEAWKRAC